MKSSIKIAIPSKGRLRDKSLKIFRKKKLSIFSKKGERDLTGYINKKNNIKILYLHAREAIDSLANGTADIAISGYDLLKESDPNIQNKIKIIKRLDFGHANLVLAVDEGWIDVQTLLDLSEVSYDFIKDKKQSLKIATKYRKLVTNFLYKKGILNCEIVESKGSTEISPKIGQANLIADITSTGSTLKANNLRVLKDGEILKSQACLLQSKLSSKKIGIKKIINLLSK